LLEKNAEHLRKSEEINNEPSSTANTKVDKQMAIRLLGLIQELLFEESTKNLSNVRL
jgi:hypothetical protein